MNLGEAHENEVFFSDPAIFTVTTSVQLPDDEWGITHDLRSPNALIVSLSESLLHTKEAFTPDEIEENLEFIYLSSERKPLPP